MTDVEQVESAPYNREHSKDRRGDAVAKKKEGEVAINYDVPEAIRRLLRLTCMRLEDAGDDVTRKQLVAEALAEGLPRVEARRMKAMKKKP
jgi:hypothetical protein